MKKSDFATRGEKFATPKASPTALVQVLFAEGRKELSQRIVALCAAITHIVHCNVI